MGKKATLKPMKKQPEVPAPAASRRAAAGELREPVVEPAEQREHRAADQHVVQVRDHEVAVVQLRVERRRSRA